ncbi:MAG: YdeI/OmpD-associated family protein [Acidimicrobiales bacterium]
MAGHRNSKPTKPEPAVLDVRSALEWEQWLETNCDGVPEGVWLRLFNKNAPETGVSYSEAVDVAICFGWIDGQARKYDSISRLQRFTPRRARSSWSRVNTERAERLIQEDKMRPPGVRAIEAAKADGRWEQAYAPPSRATIPEDFLAELRKNHKAAAFFATLGKRNTYPVAYRLETATTPETRVKRIKAMIEMFERGEKFYE